ncbi:dipeptidylpeptidase [Clydaea vesicula]|uniref:Dipeptidylpeptidase n=1 Tax=Clydaea vesicula TaxID=447962 RepID=A0AAD5XUZ4_9FUNG|nr:dipeptidylpeptidase [Clydaea vesicula]
MTMLTWTEIKEKRSVFLKELNTLKSPYGRNFEFDDNLNKLFFLGNRNANDQNLASNIFSLNFIDLENINEEENSSGAQIIDLSNHDANKSFNKKELYPIWNHLLPLKLVDKPVSKQEELLRERMRINTAGVDSFQYFSGNLETKSKILYSYGPSLFLGKTEGPSNSFNIRSLVITEPGPYFDPKLGGNTELIAFIKERNLWVATLDGFATQLTFSDRKTLSFGAPEYVVQEELDRYTGYWWAPSNTGDCSMERILYEIVDESSVGLVTIARHDHIEESRYPKAGMENARSELAIASFKPKTSFSNSTTCVERKLHGHYNLKNLFPWYEYMVRIKWLPSGDYICVQLLSRLQDRTAIVKIPTEMFMTEEEFNTNEKTLFVDLIYEEVNKYWINVTNVEYLFQCESGDKVEFVVASERSGYRHLYRIEATRASNLEVLNDGVSSIVQRSKLKAFQLTGGQWVVIDSAIHVDDHRQLVYFSANLDTPLETHFYVTSAEKRESSLLQNTLKSLPGHIIGVDANSVEEALKNFGNETVERSEKFVIKRLTKLGFSTSAVQMNSRLSKFVHTYSNAASTGLSSDVIQLEHEGSGELPSSKVICKLNNTGSSKKSLIPYSPRVPVPSFFDFKSSDDVTLYGMVYTPPNFDKSKKYPTILYLYGGPHVQLVTNELKFPKFSRLMFALSLGYVVVIIDSRGSYNRGIAFEGHLKNRMGQVELQDQIEGLLYLATGKSRCSLEKSLPDRWEDAKLNASNSYIDLNRIAIQGWSYGYDTAYTERYMGLPSVNMEGYKKGNVLSHILNFPDSENRLLIAHGLIDENVHFKNTELLVYELIQHGKPHQLQVYPEERHGLRNPKSGEHYEILLFSWLEKNL